MILYNHKRETKEQSQGYQPNNDCSFQTLPEK